MSKIKEWNLLVNTNIKNEQLSIDKDKGNLNLTLQDKVYIESEDEINHGPHRFTEPTDYARTNGGTSSFYLDNSVETCNLSTRTPSKNVNNSYKIYNPVYGYYSSTICAPSTCIQPVINVKIDDNIISHFRENITHEKTKQSDRYILKFGKYPQTKVRENVGHLLEYHYDNSLLNKEGQFAGFYTLDNKFIHNEMYRYKGELYVRSKPNLDSANRFIKYSDGNSINYKDNANTYIWHQVEPIEWEIINWDKLPASINRNGSGTDSFLKLRSVKGIISGIPFYPMYGMFENATNTSYYQNSLIRAFLNGYNLDFEIGQLHNGAIEVKSNRPLKNDHFDFISTAFDNEIEMENNMTDIVNHLVSKKNKKIKITESPMSIDDQIKFYIDNDLPFMLHGKSGIGKSRRIADIDPDYFLLTLRNGMMPEEILGKECPNPTGEGTKWYAPSWYNELCEKCKNEPDKNHILFIDELTNVNEYEQSLVYHIVLNHSLGVTSGKLPENCVVVAAGNSKDESNSAYNMSEPLFRRFHGHIYLPLDLDSLLEWGSEPRKDKPEQTNLHPIVSRFISTYPKTLYTDYDPDKEGENFAIDPRAWEQVSDIIYHNDNAISKELLINKIGQTNATMFIEFARQDFITIDEIINDNYDPNIIPRKLDEQYALALQLRQANEQEIGKVREFIANNLSGETLAKFDYVWVGNNPERAIIVDELNEEYAKKMTNNKPIITTRKHKQRAIPFSEFLGANDDDWKNIERSDKMSINCNSEEKAKLLCKALGNAGKHWRQDGQLCSENNTHYNGYNTCYTNNGTVMTYNDLLKNDVVVYDMRYIDLKDYLSDEDLDRLDDIIEKEGYKKIKLTDFIGSFEQWNIVKRKDRSYIHCQREAYADILCDALSRKEVRWINGTSYKHNDYSKYGQKTCYSNTGTHSDYTDIYDRREYPIYDFAEVDFSGIFTPEEIAAIEELIEINGDYNKYKMTYTSADIDEYLQKRRTLARDFEKLPF